MITSIHPDLQIVLSTVADGSMAAGGGAASSPDHRLNVERFLAGKDFPLQRTRLFVTYGDDNTYTDVVRVTADNAGGDIVADALYTADTGQTITLPIADCVATVVYDPIAGMLGLLHLGRHSSMAGLIESFVIEVADSVGSDPRDWYIWMSPSIRSKHDRLDYFDPPMADNWRDYTRVAKDGKLHIDTVGHNISRFVRAGVSQQHITVSPIDTYEDRRFYSQRAFSETGDKSRLGRMLVAARIVN